jgi:hypothetical protein
MKIFTPENSFLDRLNFVDNNNVLVGFEIAPQCCEQFGWYLSHEKRTDTNSSDTYSGDISDFNFDPNYFEEVETSSNCLGIVRFKLIDANKNEIFLHLFNDHNGYYSHGFSMLCSDKIINEGSI